MADKKPVSGSGPRVTDVRSGSMPNKAAEPSIKTPASGSVRTKITSVNGKLQIVECK